MIIPNARPTITVPGCSSLFFPLILPLLVPKPQSHTQSTLPVARLKNATRPHHALTGPDTRHQTPRHTQTPGPKLIVPVPIENNNFFFPKESYMLISICPNFSFLPPSPSPAQPSSIIIPSRASPRRSSSLVWHAINFCIRHHRAPFPQPKFVNSSSRPPLELPSACSCSYS
jgi:hypothetical protein